MDFKRADKLVVCDRFLLRGEEFEVTRVFVPYEGFTQIITDDGLERKFPNERTFELTYRSLPCAVNPNS